MLAAQAARLRVGRGWGPRADILASRFAMGAELELGVGLAIRGSCAASPTLFTEHS